MQGALRGKYDKYMSGKAIAAFLAAGILVAVAAVVIVTRGSDKVSASLTIEAGQVGSGGLKSTLSCNGSSSGTGLFAQRQAAEKGCASVKRVEKQLTSPQARCPQRSNSGLAVYRVTGQVNGKPVKYETFQNTCGQRMEQFARLTPLIKTMQSQIPPPKLQIMITAPPPPALTPKDIKRTERLIKRLGWKGYQRYIEEKSPIPVKGSRNLKPCPKPLPEFFAACMITVQPRVGESNSEAIKRYKKQNPEYFRNDGPANTPPLPPGKQGQPVKSR